MQINSLKTSIKRHITARLFQKLEMQLFRVALGEAFRGLTGRFLLLQIFSVAISVSPHFCFILDLILISVFLR